jgi:hypothetical protein
MTTISNSEFMAHPERYFDMAVNQDVRIQKGHQMFYIVYAPPAREQNTREEQPLLAPDDDLRNAITGEELLTGIYSDLETFFADKR